MLKNVLIILILLIGVVSCEEKKQKKINEKIKGERIKGDFIGDRLFFTEDSLFLFSKLEKTDVRLIENFRFSNNALKERKTLIFKGDGENDLYAPFLTSNSGDTLCLYDFTKNKGIKTNKKDIFNKEKWQKYTMSLGEDIVKPSMYKNSCIFLNSNEMLLIGGHAENENILSIYNVENQKYTSLDFWIEDDIPAEIITKQLVYSSNSTIYKHPLENIFIYACGFGRYVEIFTINNNKISKRNCFLSEKPLYYPVGLDFKIEKTEIDKPNGVKFVVPTHKYIYVMFNSAMFNKNWEYINYKGYSFSHNDIFQVFDWEGNHIKDIELELPCYNLSWDAKNSILYTLTEGEDSDILMKYSLE